MKYNNQMINLLPKVNNILSSLFRIVYPQYCVGCGKLLVGDKRLCHSCWIKFSSVRNIRSCPTCGSILGPYQKVDDGRCYVCRGVSIPIVGAVVLGRYDIPLDSMIREFKYKSALHIGEYLSDLLAEKLKEVDWIDEVDLIVPVPLHWLRLVSRRFNQAEFLAECVSEKLGIRWCELAKRIRYTRSQVGLSKSARIKNVKGAFRVKSKFLSDLKGMNVCIVDDIMTTGATAFELARTLKRAGVGKIYLAILGKGEWR